MFCGRMASSVMTSLKHGVLLVPPATSTVEQVLLLVGEEVGHDNISYASRMNKALFFPKIRVVSPTH